MSKQKFFKNPLSEVQSTMDATLESFASDDGFNNLCQTYIQGPIGAMLTNPETIELCLLAAIFQAAKAREAAGKVAEYEAPESQDTAENGDEDSLGGLMDLIGSLGR